eukprot:jgi/Botrbrau1/8956/Bobra.0148s0069.1
MRHAAAEVALLLLQIGSQENVWLTGARISLGGGGGRKSYTPCPPPPNPAFFNYKDQPQTTTPWGFKVLQTHPCASLMLGSVEQVMGWPELTLEERQIQFMRAADMEFSLLYLEECRATARVKICGFNKKHVPLNIAAIKKGWG